MSTTVATLAPTAMKQRRTFVATNRRQNHSCDRCRRGKRACDAIRSDEGDRNACSACARLGVECTFRWLEGLLTSPPKASKTKSRQHKRKFSFPSSEESQQSTDVLPVRRYRGSFSDYSDIWLLDDEPLFPTKEAKTDDKGLETWMLLHQATDFASSLPLEEKASSPLLKRGQVNHGTNDQIPSAEYVVIGERDLEMEVEYVHQNQQQDSSGSSLSPSARSQSSAVRSTGPQSRTNRSERSSFRHESYSPSYFGEVCRTTNKCIVSESLLQIYHDSMENALSCWLTEKTCPYEIEGIAEGGSDPQEFMAPEWGPQFSNRISMRVRSLDRASGSMRLRPLTPAEDRAASRAFDAATMAFASQWSHLSSPRTSPRAQRADGNFPPDLDGFTVENASSEFRGLFDRSVQEHLWHNARRLLQKTSGIDSFKITFAHIIFAFTQRPLDTQKHLQEAKSACSPSSNDPSGHVTTDAEPSSQCITSNSSDLDNLINLEGPPVFLETALRQLYTWRHRLGGLRNAKHAGLSSRDRKTFNLLFWLGVMLETLSAAMNNRPLVVSDEDSAILGSIGSVAQSRPAQIADMSTGNLRQSVESKEPALTPWGALFLRPTHNLSKSVIRWPCLYDDAAQALCDAAPVKVLLFRKVTTLQKLASRRASPNRLEDAIQDALDVYSHWNAVYGPLILDFIASHDTLPPRLQSWYVVLTGHWHLAVFLLADLIETVDTQAHGVSHRRHLRHSIQLLLQIRKQSAFEIAQIAEVSSPNTECSFYRTSAFHEHLNQGALLTEPWTDILIRTFGKACCLFLDWMQLSQAGSPVQPQLSGESLYASCTSCIRGLRELGRKSDMARLVAMTFAPRLQQLRARIGVNWYSEDTSPTFVESQSIYGKQ